MLCADNTSNVVKGIGSVPLVLPNGEERFIRDVLFVPGINKKNLISVPTIVKQGLTIEFKEDKCLVKDLSCSFKIVATGTPQDGLYKLDTYRK